MTTTEKFIAEKLIIEKLIAEKNALTAEFVKLENFYPNPDHDPSLYESGRTGEIRIRLKAITDELKRLTIDAPMRDVEGQEIGVGDIVIIAAAKLIAGARGYERCIVREIKTYLEFEGYVKYAQIDNNLENDPDENSTGKFLRLHSPVASKLAKQDELLRVQKCKLTQGDGEK